MKHDKTRKVFRRDVLKLPLAGGIAALGAARPVGAATRKDEYDPDNTKMHDVTAYLSSIK